MAGSLNKASILGNVGGDPDIRATQGGGRVANFSVATSETWTDKASGQKKERTEWHRVVVWNDGLVGVIEKYVHKGSKVYIEGEIQTRKWWRKGDEETNENARYSSEIVLTGFGGKLLLCGEGGDSGKTADPNENASRPGNGPGESRGIDDDMPF